MKSFRFRLASSGMSLTLTLKIIAPRALRYTVVKKTFLAGSRASSSLHSFCRVKSRAFSFRLRTGISYPCLMATASVSSLGSDGGSSSTGPRKNRLAQEKSPYLLQHASNPVDWYPWGPEALAKAKEENKLIFLSVGYSTCHWCHVMEKESFEDENIAVIMNKHFVNIKVDREERPDLDRVYMTYVQAVRGSGGWPMSVWLTPDLKPVFGGTYFPPNDRYFGQPGFQSVLLSIAKQWEEEAEKFHITGTRVLEVLARQTTIEAAFDSVIPPAKPIADACSKMLARMYEPEFGGFGRAPKFPQPVNLHFMFRYYAMRPQESTNKESLDMCVHTLKMMARGGIHDHVAQGFHRYSTDNEWHVPHFEKMLYDQAQLAVSYIEAFQITHEPIFAEVAKDILQYVGRDLNNEVGGFYSAEDADSLPEVGASAKKEGAFCVWEKREVEQLLDLPVEGKDSLRLHELISTYFTIKDGGNVDPYKDPHNELKKKNVLIISQDEQEFADKFGISLSTLKKEVQRGCNLLFEKRKQRPRPHLDDKMISAWNGMMISAFAKAGQVFGDELYLQRAVKGATFVVTHMMATPRSENLLRSCYRDSAGAIVQGARPIPGFLDDYVHVIQALLDVYEATGDAQWIEQAVRLQAHQDTLFWDEDGGAYFMAGQREGSVLVLRLKDDQDGAEPSANSVAIFNLVRLYYLMDDPIHWERAKSVLRTYSERLNKVPVALPLMVSGLLLFHSKLKKIVLAGDSTSRDMKAMKTVVNNVFIPHKVLVEVNKQTDEYLVQNVPFLQRMTPIQGVTAAYLCEGVTCSLPVTDPAELRSLLEGPQ